MKLVLGLIAISLYAQTNSVAIFPCPANAPTNTIACVAVMQTVVVVPPPPPPILGNGPLSDDFNTSALNPMWALVNPVGDGTASMTGTQLKLVAPAGKNHDPAFGQVNNSVRVMQVINNSDFTVAVKFDSLPSAQYTFEGIIIQQDSSNYIRLQIASDGTNLICNFDSIAGGTETSGPSTTIVKGTATSGSLAIQRTGTSWSLLYSLDGTRYVQVGTFNRAMTTAFIGPFVGNYSSTSAPAFTGLVNNFISGPLPVVPPPIAGSGTLNPGDDIQLAINSAIAPTTLGFNAGTYMVARELQGKSGVGFNGLGLAIIKGTGGYQLLGLNGRDFPITNMTFDGGGIGLHGSVDNLQLRNSTIQNINANVGWPASVGLFQDAIVGAQLSNSTVDKALFKNIYGPGELVCNGVFPSQGQPCDYTHDGIDLFNVSNVTISNSTFDTISGDQIHALEQISCGETGGPKVDQPNFKILNNLFTDGHRIPIEIQLCNTINPVIDSNLIKRMYLPAAWNIGLSFASEAKAGSVARITNNYVDGASTQGTGWNINGPLIEAGGTGTLVDGNWGTTARGSSNYVFYRQLGAVMGSNITFSNNKLCGPLDSTLVSFEPPCLTGACGAFREVNNTVQASCSGFPAPTVPVK